MIRRGLVLTDYIVFLCPDCSSPRYAKWGQKTAECFMCGAKIQLTNKRIRILFRTNNVENAVDAVKKIKEKQKNRIL
ncbi:DUF1922 domain-containing protein [Candidatus Bathyarchaeota archaeon]|nr:DUF1922 domain-containing protein [Candidatus Bathyarchaeota archaeon]